MKNKTVLIFGGAGFVGYNLAVYLRNIGYKVTVADNLVRRGSEQNLESLKNLNIEFIHCDIRNKEDLLNLKSYDFVLNCAAQPSAINYRNPEFDFTNNTVGLLNVLEFCRKDKTPIIFWSTNKCYSGKLLNNVPRVKSGSRFIWNEPEYPLNGWSENGFNENLDVNGSDHSIYGASKIAADMLVQEWSDAFDIPAICNRFSCLAGPNQWGKAEQGWVTWFAIANELELPIDVYGFDGYQVRDCLFTDDLNKLISLQLFSINKYRGEIFNVGGGLENSLSINEAISHLQKINKPFKSVSYHGERRADQAIYISDISKVKSHFDWEPKTSIKSGYDQIVSWVKDNVDKLRKLYI